MSRPMRREFGRGFEDEGADTTELDGLHVIFDQKVGLYPANLQKKTDRVVRRVPVRAAGVWRGGRTYAH